MPAGKVDVSQEGNTPVGINHMLLGNDTDNALYFVTNILSLFRNWPGEYCLLQR